MPGFSANLRASLRGDFAAGFSRNRASFAVEQNEAPAPGIWGLLRLTTRISGASPTLLLVSYLVISSNPELGSPYLSAFTSRTCSSNTLPGMPHPPAPEQNLVEYGNVDLAHRERLHSGMEVVAQILPIHHMCRIRHPNLFPRSFPVDISFKLLLRFSSAAHIRFRRKRPGRAIVHSGESRLRDWPH